MEFTPKNYPEIRTACTEKCNIELEVDRSISPFASTDAPATWTEYPPLKLPTPRWSEIFAQTDNTASGTFIRLILDVYKARGAMYFKKIGQNSVGVKITWPAN